MKPIHSPRRASRLVGMGLLLAGMGAGHAKRLPPIVLKGFQTRGQDANGNTSWDMSGDQATVRGALHTLEAVRLRLYLENGTTALITSPECLYNQATGLIESPAALKVESRQMTLEGVGYDVLTTEKKLRIRGNVHMKLRISPKSRRGLRPRSADRLK